MKLLFRQRIFSWLDSYDIYNERGEAVLTVRGQLSWGHCLKIFNQQGDHVGTVRERVLTFLPKFEMYYGDDYMGSIEKELTFFRPRYRIDCRGWEVEGSVMEWDYSIRDHCGGLIATVTKELFHMTDTYVLDVVNPKDGLDVLMLVLAIDAEKCSRN